MAIAEFLDHSPFGVWRFSQLSQDSSGGNFSNYPRKCWGGLPIRKSLKRLHFWYGELPATFDARGRDSNILPHGTSHQELPSTIPLALAEAVDWWWSFADLGCWVAVYTLFTGNNHNHAITNNFKRSKSRENSTWCGNPFIKPDAGKMWQGVSCGGGFLLGFSILGWYEPVKITWCKKHTKHGMENWVQCHNKNIEDTHG